MGDNAMRLANRTSKFVGIALLLGLAPGGTPAASAQSLADRIIATGKKYLGVPYKFGASMTSDVPKRFDCTAFTKYIYQLHNVILPRTGQYKVGTTIPKSALRKGDLVFFKTVSSASFVNHVGVFIGDNRILHTYGKPGVCITKLFGGYWGNHYVTARRVLPASGIAATVLKITSSKIGLRSGPGSGASIVGIAHRDERYVQVGFDYPYNTYWKKICWNGGTAWIGGGSCVPVHGAKAVRIGWTTLNVRTGPGLNYADVGDVLRDQLYAWFQTAANGGSTGLTASWHRIAFGGAYRWVSGKGSGVVVP